jgi:signal transduction histidine kinase
VDVGDDERRRLELRLREGAGRRLAELADALAQARGAAQGDTAARIARAEDVLARTRVDLSELARGLHPAHLSEAGLGDALSALAGEVPLAVSVPPARLEPDLEAVVYYVCAEALANATKHARATQVAIDVRRDDGRVLVEVTDDGVGGADAERGTGLRGLRDRLEARGGRLEIDSPRGGGTRLVAEIP